MILLNHAWVTLGYYSRTISLHEHVALWKNDKSSTMLVVCFGNIVEQILYMYMLLDGTMGTFLSCLWISSLALITCFIYCYLLIANYSLYFWA